MGINSPDNIIIGREVKDFTNLMFGTLVVITYSSDHHKTYR